MTFMIQKSFPLAMGNDNKKGETSKEQQVQLYTVLTLPYQYAHTYVYSSWTSFRHVESTYNLLR